MEDLIGRGALCVEGSDDHHAILHLLRRHGIECAKEPILPQVPRFDERKGVDDLLRGMETRIIAAIAQTIGFVLDADSPLADRWHAVRERLLRAKVEVPDTIPPLGFIGESSYYRVRVGVWLMPDNRRDGTLEDFLEDLVVQEDALLPHAKAATGKAREKGARFPAVAERKAVLHAWLAWQEVPGRPYGTAMTAHYFRHDSPAALAFVTWFRDLYGIR